MASPITTDTKEIRPIDPDSTSLLYVNLQDNLEPFTVVWADTQINKSEDCLKTQDNLQRIINCLKLFDDAQKCILFVENTSNDDIIFLIVSGELGNTILASLHALPQVAYVYAFCFESAIHEQWTKHYEKIRGVFTDKNLLFEQIKMDVKAQCSRWSFTTEHTFTNPSKSTFSRVPK
ncbi:unnamed protein product [Adineta steineri]|uniref:Uncharacterized protein n=1 Tax=Adineta steineri TaxID=433720 RepID=A0A815E7H9_9BILA|nr:unnamed protein product [Adineta steineri]CAF1334959.1 unnamed protein product [Adineta steineri]CAF1578481.1 unnamed protein product [Adineta steineri]CAF1590836.1 unnamed protein product [Adineta steineri]